MVEIGEHSFPLRKGDTLQGDQGSDFRSAYLPGPAMVASEGKGWVAGVSGEEITQHQRLEVN